MARPKAITRLSDAPSYYKWLFYSPPGRGKTVLAGTAPKALFLTVDPEGTESAKLFGSTAEEWVINSMSDLREAEQYFRAGSGCRDFQWVILDSISEMEDLMWSEILTRASGKVRDMPTLPEYQVVMNRMIRMVGAWLRLPVNVLYTAHAMPFVSGYDEETGDEIIEMMPLLGSVKNGKTSTKICAKVSTIAYLDVKRIQGKEGVKKVRRLYLEARPGIIAKNRSDLGPWVDNPTIPALIAASRKRRAA